MIRDDDIEHIYLDDDQSAPKDTGHRHVVAVERRGEYKKFSYVLISILVVSSMLTFIRGIELSRFISDFMAVFFITFSAFKFYDIEAFAHAYRKYDVIIIYIWHEQQVFFHILVNCVNDVMIKRFIYIYYQCKLNVAHKVYGRHIPHYGKL